MIRIKKYFKDFLEKERLVLSFEYNADNEYPWEVFIKDATIMKYGREQTRSATSDSPEGAIKYLEPLLRGTTIKIDGRDDILVSEDLFLVTEDPTKYLTI